MTTTQIYVNNLYKEVRRMYKLLAGPDLEGVCHLLLKVAQSWFQLVSALPPSALMTLRCA